MRAGAACPWGVSSSPSTSSALTSGYVRFKNSGIRMLGYLCRNVRGGRRGEGPHHDQTSRFASGDDENNQ